MHSADILKTLNHILFSVYVKHEFIKPGIIERREYQINIAGGDLSAADKLIIDVSMLGIVKKKGLVLRRGAKIGDILFVLLMMLLLGAERLQHIDYLRGNPPMQ